MAEYEWGSPLKQQQKTKEPKEKPTKQLKKFEKEVVKVTKGDAKKIVNYNGDLSYHQRAWVQRWLEQLMRERSLPPQIAGSDALGQLNLFLSPSSLAEVFVKIREDFQRTLPEVESNPYQFLESLVESEAYLSLLPPPHTSSRNNHSQDDVLGLLTRENKEDQ
jgi:hypothetical protein